MLRSALFVVSSSLLSLSLVACERGDDMPSSTRHADPASVSFDLKFIDTMSAHHQDALDMAKLAETKASHAELRTMAVDMQKAQKAEIDQMAGWRNAWSRGAAPAVDHEMKGMKETMAGMDMGKLESAQGADFDHAFIDMMVKHHAGAVTMANDALANASRPEVKQLAQKIVSDQTREITQLRGWSAAWFDHAHDAPARGK